jgi:CDP-6-deoxy-D-xylo-4-hexulose-3-dehydrase
MKTQPFKSRPLDLAVDTISPDDLEELITWLRQYPRLTMAEETRRFEQEWSAWLGVKYSIFCNSGSSANLLMIAALDALGQTGNRKIIVPATGWGTTLAPTLQYGMVPLLCEADRQTFALDPDSLAALLEEEQPDTVMLVHVLGIPARIQPILELQERYGFTLLEDCCAGHGARCGPQKIGTIGRMSSFSFFYGHHMSTIEGGMVCTDDEELYHTLMMLRSHGWSKELPEAVRDRLLTQHGFDSFTNPIAFMLPGYNLRPTDLNARLGRIQLKRLDDAVAQRSANHAHYQARLAGHLDYAHACEGDLISSISFCAVADSARERQHIVERLIDNKIDTRLFTAANLGRHPLWTQRFEPFAAPMADRLFNGGFFLPNNPAISESDIDFICDTILKD